MKLLALLISCLFITSTPSETHNLNQEDCLRGRSCFKVLGRELICYEVEICGTKPGTKIPKEIYFDISENENGILLKSKNAPSGRYILKEDALRKMNGKVFTLPKGNYTEIEWTWKVEEGTAFIMWDK